jgi:hypothetical protein
MSTPGMSATLPTLTLCREVERKRSTTLLSVPSALPIEDVATNRQTEAATVELRIRLMPSRPVRQAPVDDLTGPLLLVSADIVKPMLKVVS